MRIERKVLKILKKKDSSAHEVASEIMASPKTVLKVIEQLEKAGLLAENGARANHKHDIHTVHTYAP